MEQQHFTLRYRIMTTLYDAFKKYPDASMDIRELEEQCATNPETLNWNLAYLEKCGYLELGRMEDFPPYIAAVVSITARGIDLVEDEKALKTRFNINPL
ncbi:MAG: hypothetical protein DRH32_04660 [Deltaproteobacteria bacterium]|nr:MAG: hypothetical protein DRH32_04660 [Deltaproteobacteria bacterium]